MQYRFLGRYPEIIQEAIQASKFLHATSSAQARLKLEVIAALIGEPKSERSNTKKLLEKQQVVDVFNRGIEAIRRLED